MKLPSLLQRIRSCIYCEPLLPLGARPVVQMSNTSPLLIVGQAPGVKVHNTSIPFNDASGDTLRQWLDVDRGTFYNAEKIAILPMGFCYPGNGKNGDMPPRPECAEVWREKVHAQLHNVQLTLLIGQYAQNYYLQDKRKSTVTETVRAYKEYLKMGYFPLVHPSPRNKIWHIKNPWFAKEVIPILQEQVHRIL